MRISDWSSDVCSSDLVPDRLARALSRVREWRSTERAPTQKSKWINEFWVQNRGEMLRIDAGQVDLIEAERDYMRLHVGGRSWLIHQTIKSLEARSEEHTSELQSLMRISYAVFRLNK